MNIKGKSADTVYPLMGSMKVPDEALGKGKLALGIRKTDSKAFQAFVAGMNERVGITWQKDNRGAAKGEVEMNPYLSSTSYGEPGAKKTSHMTFFSNKVGLQRDESGKVLTGEDGQPIQKEGKSQVGRIFDAIPSVEITKGNNGTFMHFACDAPVKVTKNGLIPDIDQMQGKPAEKGMGDAQFNTTLEAKREAKAAREAQGKETAAPDKAAEAVAKAAAMEQPAAAGMEMETPFS